MKIEQLSRMLLLALLSFAPGQRAEAADTLEPFQRGALDLELHLGHDGVGLTRAVDPATAAELVVGWGITERLSASLATCFAAGTVLAEGQHTLAASLFGNLLDTRHFDLDLLGIVETEDPAQGHLGVAPGFELNLDHTPDWTTWGVFLRGSLPVEPRARAGVDEATLAVELTLGAYWSLAAGHQLLLEAGFTPWTSPTAERNAARGPQTLAAGYNVALNDTLELVGHLHVTLPGADGPAALGWATGLIGTFLTGDS